MLADEGCRLALCDLNSCDALCAEVADAGGEAAAFEVDLADTDSIVQLARVAAWASLSLNADLRRHVLKYI